MSSFVEGYWRPSNAVTVFTLLSFTVVQFFFLLAPGGILTKAEVYRIPMRKTESLLHRLVKDGSLSVFVREQQRASRKKCGLKLMDYLDEFYLANVSLGTPPQWFELWVDTGSSNVWVVSTQCTSRVCYGNNIHRKNRFNASASSTFHLTGKPFRIDYASGNAQGVMATDVISFSSLRYPKQVFGTATSISSVFGAQPIDGIIGFGWPALAGRDEVPPMQNVLPQLDKPLFTVYFRRNVEFTTSAVDGGLVTFGSVDVRNCARHVDYVPLSSQTYWQITLSGVRLGKYSSGSRSEAISDTGSSWIGGPTAIIQSVIAAAGGAYDADETFQRINCNAMHSNKSLIFTINHKKYEVPSIQYVIDLGLSNNQCVITLYGFDMPGFGPQWVLGAPFIRSYCQIYDIGNARLGLAKPLH